ncbi:arrestin domain-containing protein 4-like [Haliotis asinina]|uniref:arrestin domain-containing protein 4-like n=1 Tax=Haliotis asinina TaxID=109174 RepID=UPI003531B9CF
MAYPVLPELFTITLNPNCLKDVWNTNPLQRPLIDVVKPGSYVEGVLRITVSESLRCNGIFLSARGHMCVYYGALDGEEWLQLQKANFTSIQERFKNEEYHVEMELMVLPKLQLLDCRGQGLLAPGEHQLPFRFEVPASLPSSFQGDCGFIIYSIEASIDQRPYGADITYRKDFHIHGFFDLNQTESALTPYQEKREDSNCCLCCANGSYSFKIILPKRGFERREIVRPVIEMTNTTQASIVAELTFSKSVRYTIRGQVWTGDFEVLKEYSHQVQPGLDEIWTPDITLGDQLLPSQVLPPCINVIYSLRLELELTGCNCDKMETEIEIMVGDLSVEVGACPLPVMTQPQPQTYIYEQVDLTARGGGVPERHPLLPAGYPQKARIPQARYCEGYSGGLGPPITHQPSAPSAPPSGDVPPPPSYSECIQMTVLSGPGDPPAPRAGHPAGFPQAAAALYSPPAQSYPYYQPGQEKYS